MTNNAGKSPERKSLQETRAYLAQALPLRDAMIFGAIPPDQGSADGKLAKLLPEVVSLIWVDASHRPDIRDLVRVHALDGDGDGEFLWTYIDKDQLDSYFVLNVNLSRPVRVTFRIAFRMVEWSTLIEIVATTGSLSLVVGPPPAWRELAQTIEPAALLEEISRQGGGILGLIMNEATMAELQQHSTLWKKRFGHLLGTA